MARRFPPRRLAPPRPMSDPHGRGRAARRLGGVSGAALALGLLAAPGADAIPAVAYDRGCYNPGQPIIETGSGFTPGTQVVESLTLIDEDAAEILAAFASPPVAVDPLGAFTRGIKAPPLARRADRRELALSAFADPSVTEPITVQWTLSGWDVTISSPGGRVRRHGRMRVEAWGWQARGETLYLHYVRGKKRVRSVRLGTLSAPCGDLDVSVRQFPFAAKPGKWRFYLSTTPRFDPRAAWIRFQVRLAKPHRPARSVRTAGWRQDGRHATR